MYRRDGEEKEEEKEKMSGEGKKKKGTLINFLHGEPSFHPPSTV
jgi:hypothetical protein